MLKYIRYTAKVFESEYWKANTRQIRQKTSFSEYDSWVPIIETQRSQAIVFRFEYWFLGPGCTRLGTRSWALSSSMQSSSQLTNSHKSHLLMIFCFGGRLEKSDMNSQKKTRRPEQPRKKTKSRTVEVYFKSNRPKRRRAEQSNYNLNKSYQNTTLPNPKTNTQNMNVITCTYACNYDQR